jgi:hypothetical protein
VEPVREHALRPRGGPIGDLGRGDGEIEEERDPEDPADFVSLEHLSLPEVVSAVRRRI